jgi:glutamate synthase (NADPH/NADH) large chain
MTGGLAWVLDEDGTFTSEMKYHPEFIDPQPFASAEIESQNNLKTLIEEHISLSDSGLAKTLLLEWADRSKKFVRLSPKPQA